MNWCASGPCLNNGTCTVNQQLGTFQCNCANGWTGVTCAYRKFNSIKYQSLIRICSFLSVYNNNNYYSSWK